MTDDRKPLLMVEPAEKETLVDYALIKLSTRRDHRRLPKDVLRENTYMRLEPPGFSIKPEGKEAFVCQPFTSLTPGEYILVYLSQTLGEHEAGYKVYPFSIP